MRTQQFLLSVLSFALLFSACRRNDPPVNEGPAVATGLYILNEGLFNQNNSTLTYFDLASSTATTDYYAIKNGSGLGDLGNDMLLYGDKLYIVMNGSSYVEVTNARTGVSLQKIPFRTASNAPRQPRSAAAYQNKVLVTSFDGTVAVIDTTSLTVDRFISVGSNPEGLAVFGSKLFVANSGGLSFPNFDSTVSVIDLNTFTETAKIRVGINPNTLTVDDAGNVYVSCVGDYGNIPPRLVKINAANNSIVKTADTVVGDIRYYNGFLYVTGGYLGTSNVRKLNTTDFAQASANFVTDGTVVQTPYGINIDERNGDVYVTDARDYVSSGLVHCFDKDGKRKFSFSTAPGVNPNTIAFIRQ